MKKLLMTTAALTCLSGAAFANMNDSAQLSRDSGFYVGGLGGYDWTSADTDATGVDFDARGWDYGVFAGYKVDALLDNSINRLGLGLNGALEVQYVWSTADDEDGGDAFEKNHEFGVTFRPGLNFLDRITPFSLNPYGIVGYRRAEFDSSVAGAGGNENYNGFELGIGTELMAYGDYGVRVDYSHVWYGAKNGIDPDENDLRVGVAYHF